MHISYPYGQYPDMDLRYAYKPSGGNWQISTIESTGDVGIYSDLKIDSLGGIHVLYKDSTNKYVKYAYKPSGSSTWIISIINTERSFQYTGNLKVALAIDSLNGLHVIYGDGATSSWYSGVWYAYKSSGSSTWTKSVIDSTPRTGSVSIAIDSNNGVHAFYYDAGAGTNIKSNLIYVYRTTPQSDWLLSYVDGNGGIGNDLIIDSEGQIHASYDGFDVARYAKRNLGESTTAPLGLFYIPNPMPSSYVTRAGYLWRLGGAYHYDASCTLLPPNDAECWLSE